MARLNAAGSSTCGRWPQPDKISAWASGSRAAARWAWPRGRSRSWSAPDQQQGWRAGPGRGAGRSGCRCSWRASKGRSAWRAFLSGRRTGEPGQQIRHNGDLGADQAQQPHEVVRAQLPFRPRSPRNRPCLATRGGTREPGGWRPGCGATWVRAAPAAHLCRQAMSGCGGGQVLRPEGGRGGRELLAGVPLPQRTHSPRGRQHRMAGVARAPEQSLSAPACPPDPPAQQRQAGRRQQPHPHGNGQTATKDPDPPLRPPPPPNYHADSPLTAAVRSV
jgi:hypothetical protein